MRTRENRSNRCEVGERVIEVGNRGELYAVYAYEARDGNPPPTRWGVRVKWPEGRVDLHTGYATEIDAENEAVRLARAAYALMLAA